MRKTTYKIFLQSLTGVSLLFLAGCSGASQYMQGDNQKRNEVQMVRIPYVMTYNAGEKNLNATEVDRLDHFMMASNVSYGDELSMDFPLTRDGQLSAESQARFMALNALLRKRGLHLKAEVTPYGVSPGENQARLLISRYLVTPPQCGDWSQPSTENFNNAPMANFGCASQAQLGLMVANPRDLISGVNDNRPNAEQAAKAVSGYLTKPSSSGTSTSVQKQ